MISVYLPDNNITERQYIINILLEEFLGITYKVEVRSDISDYILVLGNGKKLIIKDCFFSLYPNDLSYLQIGSLPKTISHSQNQFIIEKDIPIIYGNNNIEILENQIICGIDIFASSFFMLTRWEEYVNKTRDQHFRFPVIESISFKNQFLERPIVNEYLEMLWNILTFMNIEQNRKEGNYKVILTHDIDFISKNDGRPKNFNFLKKNNLRSIIEKVFYSIYNPYNTFEFLMRVSEKNGCKSHFYFMSGSSNTFDGEIYLQKKLFKKVIKKIISREHIVGFHPSYQTFNDNLSWVKEKQDLSVATEKEIVEGRQHYLRFEAPYTWDQWNQNNMKYHSSLYYAEAEGFRCGTCYEYSVFDFLTRKKLKLKELPLSLMDTTLTYYQHLSVEEAKEKIRNLSSLIRKYQGVFVILWHNSSFNVFPWKPYKKVYEDIVKEIS